jgi:rubrerythrin
MNVQHILTEIEKTDPEVYERLDTRRGAMKQFSFLGKALVAAAVPFAFGSMFKKAYGQTTSQIVDTLNFALTLEHLEAEFYKQVVASTVLPAADRPAFERIKNDEVAHVNFLKTAITALGGTPVNMTAANFDFSGGNGSNTGPFANVFTNYSVLLAVSQTFEDTGVRAYKGQAGNLMSNNDVLTAALQIHSVEARHAAKLRQLRREAGTLVPTGVTVRPWITLNQSGIATGNAGADGAIQLSYNGEDLTTQGGANIVGIGGNTGINARLASEAFDEPLSRTQVEAIVDPFIR